MTLLLIYIYREREKSCGNMDEVNEKNVLVMGNFACFFVN